MKIRTGLGAILAFCAALGLGHYFFRQAPATPAANSPLAQYTETYGLVKTASPGSIRTPELERALLTSRMLHESPIDRSLTAVDGGVKNSNKNMSHFFATDYSEGTFHKVDTQFGAAVRWLPQTQELWQNNQVLAVLGSAKSTRGRIHMIGALSQVIYSNTYPQTEEHFYVRPDGGVEHDIVVQQPPLALADNNDLVYAGYMQLSANLTLWDGFHQITGSYTTANEVQIKNSFGNTVMVLHRPVAFDASVTAPDGSFDAKAQAKPEHQSAFAGCRYRFEFNDSGVRLAIVASGKWLTDPARAYPVTIDPVFGPFGLADGNPPLYTAAVSTNTVIPATGGTMVPMTLVCPSKNNDAAGLIAMPFPFTYYGQSCALLELHEDGFARFVTPTPPCPRVAIPITQICPYDAFNRPLPTAGLPYFPHIAAYWDDLRFGPPASDGATQSAIYYFVDGAAPNRRLIVEWYRMAFVGSGSSGDVISFNLILHECENQVEVIIGEPGDTDLNMATVGIQDFTATRGIQYTYNGAAAGEPPITPGTAIVFTPTSVSGTVITPNSAAGCAPLAVCFSAVVNTPPINCGSGSPLVPSFAYHWIFDYARGAGTQLDPGEAFTASVCHTYKTPGLYQAVVIISDISVQPPIQTVSTPITIRVCDTPQVVIGVTPQGGAAPLNVTMELRTPIDANLQLTGSATWNIDQLGLNNEPGVVKSLGTLDGNLVTYTFADPGTYRVAGSFTAIDIATGLNTTGTGIAYVFVTPSDTVIQNSMIITESKMKIDWKGKIPPPNPNGLVPAPVAPNPNNDSIALKGVIPLPGISQSALIGRRVRVVLNGVYPLIDAIFNAGGSASQGDASTGTTGTFNISLPSGEFTATAKGSLFGYLGVSDVTQHNLLLSQYRIEIEGLFPDPNAQGPIISYNYTSTAFKSASGSFKFGSKGLLNAPATGLKHGSAVPGGTTAFVSGAFLVTGAKITLQGNTVFANLKGLLSRAGGDSLRPAANSDVVVSLGNFTEALNFSTTPAFKSTAKKVTFKRAKGLGATGVATLQWTDRAGNFSATTFGLANEMVGINPALATQALTLGLTITPDNGVPFKATTRFQITKVSATQFVLGKAK